MSRTNTVDVPYGVCSFLNKGYVLSVMKHEPWNTFQRLEHAMLMHTAMLSCYLSVYIWISTGDSDIYA